MKHCIKLCTKIQIYYSYCIPFSTDFLRLFFQFSWQQPSQAWPDPGAGGSCRSCAGGQLPEGGGHRRAGGWQRPLAGSQQPPWSPVTLAPSLTAGPQGATYLLPPAPTPGWAMVPAEPFIAIPSSLYSSSAQGCPSRGCGPALLPASSSALRPAPGSSPARAATSPSPVAPWGPADSPWLLALRRGQC